MFKRGIMKNVVCTVVVLMVLLSCFSLNTFAADTKTVSKVEITSTTCPDTAIGDVIKGMSGYYSTQTRYYDDGVYRGTLNFDCIFVISKQLMIAPNIYTYQLGIKFSGTVTARNTKTVTVTKTYTFSCPASLYSSVLSSNVSKTLPYNDGVYAGTLTLDGHYLLNKTLIVPSADVYTYTIQATYSGTVTEIK